MQVKCSYQSDMTFKTIWKTGHSWVVSLNAQEVNHLELWEGNNVTITCHGKRQIRIIRHPKVQPRNNKPTSPP